MSWQASSWAKEQRLGNPLAKSILLCLADYADPEKALCWPSQTRLAEDAEVSERSVREWLQRLEDWGLISRSKRSRSGGGRASDMIELHLDARVTDGSDRARQANDQAGDCAAGEAGGSAAEPEGKPAAAAGLNRQDAAEHTGSSCRASLEQTNLTSQPARERAREKFDRISENKEDRKSIEAAFWRTIKDWPRFAGMPKAPALKVWWELTPDERVLAERRRDAWLAKLGADGIQHKPSPSTYFRERLWTSVPDPQEAERAPEQAAPFGKLWSAMRLAALLQEPAPLPKPTAFIERLLAEGGEAADRERAERLARHGWPKVTRMHEAAGDRRGWRPEGHEGALGALAAGFEPVNVGSDLWEEWRQLHADRGWPWLPDTGRLEWVHFPAGGPASIAEFERTLRGNGDDDAGQ